ncbi:MAG: histidine kinase, partial [Actinocatenispora sp.]
MRNGWRVVWRAVLALTRPVRDPACYPRLVFLMLGSALALAFTMIDISVLLAVPFARLWLPVAALVPLAVIGLPPVAVSLIPAVRVVEGSAVRSLVYRPLPANLPPARDWDTRWRASLWFLLHLATGAVAAVALMAAVVWSVGLVLAPLRGTQLLAPFAVSVGPGWSTAWLPLLILPLVAGYLYLTAGLGTLLAWCARPLLGPSAPERLAALQSRTNLLAERNRLARELHDSVGHALTVTTLQAGAAGRVLDSDPVFARQALAAIEETGRAALADLDHVLGLLREESAERSPSPTLSELDGLLAQTRATGVEVTVQLTGEPESVPTVVSREAYRIVQESLTNAVRHAGPVPVAVRLDIDEDRLALELTNPIAPARRSARPRGARRGGGRG